jgi:hemerythrin-like domain-containing protein
MIDNHQSQEISMDAIEGLMKEHRIIEKTLDALEAWAGEVGCGGADGRDELRRFVTFLRDFADACHHAKEEDILFAVMVEHGFSREQGPIAVMLHEHEHGRLLLGALDKLARQAGPWSAKERERLVQLARAYSMLLRQHIGKEDMILYPMAEANLPDAVKSDLVEQLARFEEEETGSGEHERLHGLAHSLIAAHAPGADPGSGHRAQSL